MAKRNTYSKSKESEHLALIKKKEDAKKVRRPFEQDWYMNIAFLANEQYVNYVPYTDGSGSLVAVDFDDMEDAPTETVNVMAKISRIERAKLLRVTPIPEALPMTGDYEDLVTAQILTAYFDDLRHQQMYQRTLRSAVYWTVATGNGFFKVHWDNENGQDADVTVVAPFDMYPDPYPKNFYDSRWVITTQFMDPDVAKELYGDYPGAKSEHLEATQSEPVNSIENRLLYNYGDTDRQIDGVVVNEYWEPPNKTNPDGKYCVFTDSGVVLSRSFPYAHKKLPFAHIGHIQRGHTKWYASVLDYIRPLQKELNAAENRVTRNAQISQGKWIIHDSVELEQDPDASTGQIMKFSGPKDSPPVLETNSSLPQWVQDEPMRITGIMNDLAMQHEVSNAGVPGRVDSGSGIQLLQEADDSVMKDTIHSLEEAIERTFTQAAQLYAQYGSATRIVPVYDKDGFVEVEHLLRKDDLNIDQRVRVKTTTGLPQSIAGRFDRVVQLFTQGIIEDPKIVLELIDLAPIRSDLDQTMQDKRRAIRENLMFADNKPFKPKKGDNHSLHIRYHQMYQKTDEYDQLPLEVQEMVEWHIELHKTGELQNAQEEAQLQMAIESALGGSEQSESTGGGSSSESAPPPADGMGPPPVVE